MLSFAQMLVLALFIGGGWYWYDAMRAKERARDAGRRRCDEAGVTFLDDTVTLTRLRVRRDGDGRLSILREFQFEFTSDGSVRHGGEITLIGGQIRRIEMEPYRAPPPDRPAIDAAPDADRKWLH
jgi:hypothetical protein